MKDEVSASLDRLKERLEGVASVVGESAQLVLTNHLAAKEASGSSHKTASKLGAEPSGLYADMARAISHSIGTDQVTLSINHVAAAQRYYGGTITPKKRKYLTIPVSASAYGKGLGAGDFTGNLLWLFGKNGPYGVALKSNPEELLFILAKSVTQPADSTVLPDEAPWTSRILDTVASALGLESEGPNG